MRKVIVILILQLKMMMMMMMMIMMMMMTMMITRRKPVHVNVVIKKKDCVGSHLKHLTSKLQVI